MSALKSVANAFIVGGILGLIGHILLKQYIGVLGPDSPIIGLLLLITMGIIGGILFNLKIYQKLEESSGFGAMLPFSGLASAIAGAIVGTRSSGAPLSQAIKSGLMVVVTVVGTGTLLSIIIGLIAFFVA
ncbi:MAG: SpoVA/SpoVAEb family sporulation membrane protein [Eubacteriales bacterium]